MQRRFYVGALLVIALMAISSQAPAQVCGMSMPTQMVQCECCATMKTCLLPQQNLVQSATPQASQQSVAMIAPVLQELLALAPVVGSSSREFPTPQPTVDSPSRLALFCTFLI